MGERIIQAEGVRTLTAGPIRAEERTKEERIKENQAVRTAAEAAGAAGMKTAGEQEVNVIGKAAAKAA